MSPKGASLETRFSQGQVGADGAALEATREATEVEQDKAREALLRGRTWLGRECLTYWLWRSESSQRAFEFEGEDVALIFHGRLALKAGAGAVTEMLVKGVTAPYSKLVKQALGRGVLVHVARLKIALGERVYEATVDAEFFDVKAVKLPTLVSEDADEKLLERLALTQQLARIVESMAREFIHVRRSKKWPHVVGEISHWLQLE
jgi:hypothetical protein